MDIISRDVLKLLIEHIKNHSLEFNSPSSLEKLSTYRDVVENYASGQSLLEPPKYTVELLDLNPNEHFHVLMNLYANQNYNPYSYREKPRFTFTNTPDYEYLVDGLKKLGVKFRVHNSESSPDSNFHSSEGINSVSPFPGNMGIKPGIRRYKA